MSPPAARLDAGDVRRRAETRFQRSIALLERLGDLLLLGVLWLVASLAVVTAFAATAATFAVVHAWVHGDERAPLQAFGREIAALARPATLLGLAWTLAVGVLTLDVLLVMQMGTGSWPLLVGFGLLAAVLAAGSPWLLPALVHGHRGRRVPRAALRAARDRPIATLACLLLATVVGFTIAVMPVTVLLVPPVAVLGWVRLTAPMPGVRG